MMRAFFVLPVLLFLFANYSAAQSSGGEGMKISCPEFKNNATMPSRFTCEGEEVSPPLVIEGTPQNAQSLALIVDDPDAARGVWVHWVVFDIPPRTSRIEENSVPGKLGMTDSGKKDYHGPCPPSGTHRYFFKVYALDIMLNLSEGTTRSRLEEAMQGHILDKAELVGLYKRK